MNKIALLFLLACSSVFAYQTDINDLSDNERECYAASMIGFDSVINSRVGVPAEHAIRITSGHDHFTKTSPLYRDNLRITIWTAYLWKDSPHTYAVKTFASCIKEHNK